MEKFQDNLRVLCEGRQGQIAEAAGISRIHLNRIINGHRDPSLDIVIRLADALNVSLDDLCTDAEKKFSNVA